MRTEAFRFGNAEDFAQANCENGGFTHGAGISFILGNLVQSSLAHFFDEPTD